MKILRGFAQLILAFSLSALILSYALLQLVSTGTGMSDILNRGGVYELIASQARTQLAESPKVPVKYQTLFATSLDKTVTQAQIEAILKPAIVDIATWVNQPDGTPAPDVIMIIKPAKDSLIKEMSDGGLTGNELVLLQAQLSQQIPDQIKLSSLNELVGSDGSQMPSSTTSGTGVSADADSASDPSGEITKGLQQIKSGVGVIRIVFIASAIAILVCTLLVVILSRKLGRSLTRAVSIIYLFEGGLWLLLALVLPSVLSPTQDTLTAATLANHMLPLILQRLLSASLLPAIIIMLIGAIGLGVSFILRGKPSIVQPIQPRH